MLSFTFCLNLGNTFASGVLGGFGGILRFLSRIFGFLQDPAGNSSLWTDLNFLSLPVRGMPSDIFWKIPWAMAMVLSNLEFATPSAMFLLTSCLVHGLRTTSPVSAS